ncbi:uncharacterized isoform X1 [Zea mays]|uniref:uncharacterized isoform X1 n=1 Tax=Zea mays TaxID=4577 RepID=UPI001651CC5E|nr:uncharacterized protein LOC100279006 isoform X1 [Zea mays]
MQQEASVAIFFSFEYMILATSTLSTFVKYIFYVSDMLMEGQWEKKAVYTFYLVRELYVTFRNFRIRIADYVRYRKITSNMNERFPDATSEELDVSDATCIICREEMATAKKLLDGHLFHVHCLRETGEQAKEEVPLRLLHGSFSSTGRILSTGTMSCCLPQCASQQ